MLKLLPQSLAITVFSDTLISVVSSICVPYYQNFNFLAPLLIALPVALAAFVTGATT
jgi:hypothetical protein